MKKTPAVAIATLALCVSAFGAGYTVKTLDGQILTDVRVKKFGTDSVRLTYSDGIIDVPLANFSPEDKKLLGIQDWLDFVKRRADEALADKKRRDTEQLAWRKLAKKISADDYPPELRSSIERYNFSAEVANKDLIATAPDVHRALESLDSSAPKSEFEAIQREFEQTSGRFPEEEKQKLRTKAGNELHRLWKDLAALDNYKAKIAGTENEAAIREGVAKGETFLGMPDFAVHILKGQPYESGPVGVRAEWKYLNSNRLFDRYLFENGKLVSEQLR